MIGTHALAFLLLLASLELENATGFSSARTHSLRAQAQRHLCVSAAGTEIDYDRPNILAFGSACVDLLAICDHFPQPDEKMRSTRLLFEGGGNAANTACAIGRLSDYVTVHVATAVGNDDYGNRIVEGLEQDNVGVQNVERFVEDGAASPFSYILVTPDNARTIIHQPAIRDMSVEFADSIDLAKISAVHFDGRNPKAAVRLSERLCERNIPYSVDVERPRGEGHDELLENASIIICSSDYCNKVLSAPLHDPPTDEEYVRRLRKVARAQAPSAAFALQTIGSKGSYLVRLNEDSTSVDDRSVLLQGEPDLGVPAVTCHSGAIWCSTWDGFIDIVDSTGAGDAFQGGFIAGLWSYVAKMESQTDDVSPTTTSLDQIPTEALAHAMRIGTRVAAKKLESLGARKGLPYSSEDVPLQNEFQGLFSVVQAKTNPLAL